MTSGPVSNLFEPYLLTGERILWTGQPKQGIALRPADSFLIPFGLFFAGFALLWNAGVWFLDDGGEGAPLLFKLFGLPFLVGGAYVLIGRFFHDAAVRKSLFYAVTDQRILTLRKRKFSSRDLRRLPMLELAEHRDGTGTIAFDSGPSLMNFGRASGFDIWVPSLAASSQLFRIENPRKVYEIIRDAEAR